MAWAEFKCFWDLHINLCLEFPIAVWKNVFELQVANLATALRQLGDSVAAAPTAASGQLGHMLEEELRQSCGNSRKTKRSASSSKATSGVATGVPPPAVGIPPATFPGALCKPARGPSVCSRACRPILSVLFFWQALPGRRAQGCLLPYTLATPLLEVARQHGLQLQYC